MESPVKTNLMERLKDTRMATRVITNPVTGKRMVIRIPYNISRRRQEEKKEMEVLGIPSKKSYRRIQKKVRRLERERTLNLCDNCIYPIPECKGRKGRIVYGTGIGGDNVIQCNVHQWKK